MRLEATISDVRAEQVQHIADELHITKSQLVEEALALFQKAVLEMKRGRRLAIVEADTQRAICEVASPSLTQLEWTAHREKIELSAEGMKKVQETIEHPPAPTAALRAAAAMKRRRSP